MKLECNAFPMPELRLYHSRGKCLKALHRLGCATEPSDADAQMWLVGDVAVVLMEGEADWHAEAALLVHEAVHVADEWLKAMGEDSPGDEERAYVVQCVAEPLFRAHERWKRKHVKVR
jgi:hypothetical protein